jgi:hypothetical protein
MFRPFLSCEVRPIYLVGTFNGSDLENVDTRAHICIE